MENEKQRSHILTVRQLTERIKSLLEEGLPDVWVEGEVSNLRAPQSGHVYFTLKDQQSQINAVLFRSSHRFLKFTLIHGMQVICRGRIGVYEPRGEYQLVVQYIEPKGLGALQQAFEELKARLSKEGLFDPAHKKPLPLLPGRIGIITSPTGAAIRDILRVIKRRHPRMHILLYPVSVQGASAAPEIVEALEYFNSRYAVDVIILGRGGGSLEDLWAFNEETVARAIYGSKIPVISAVGHETDYTISDFVADLRAPTPSAAAEMVVETEERLRETIGMLELRLKKDIKQKIEIIRAVLREKMRLLIDPRKRLEQYSQRIDELLSRLASLVKNILKNEKTRLAALTAGLDHLNPLSILSRGYSITKKLPDGKIITDAGRVTTGDLISTRLSKGTIISRVEGSDSG